MCAALDMPCGASGDFYHIEAQLYRMGVAHISNLRSKYIEMHLMNDHQVRF